LSEQYWKEFLQANGLEDWVVLHGGPSAVFLTASLVEAAELASAVAQLPGLDGSNAQLTIVSKRFWELWSI
jgi:4a-hydroxytetrahydrobiopterin dehydratase